MVDGGDRVTRLTQLVVVVIALTLVSSKPKLTEMGIKQKSCSKVISIYLKHQASKLSRNAHAVLLSYRK